MKVAVVGSGAVGLYYGAKLAMVGIQTQFLMRSGFGEAKESGIRIFEPDGFCWGIEQAEVFENPGDITNPDIILISLKSTSNRSLPELLGPMLGSQTALITLQNGIGIEERLAEEFPGHLIAGGLCFVCLNRITPTKVRHIGAGSLTLGWHSEGIPQLLEDLAGAWSSAGIKASLSPDLFEERWRKLVWNIPFNGLGIVAGGVGVNRILEEPGLFSRCRELMEEVRETANLLGCSIPEEFLDQQIEATRPMGNYLPSSVLDYQSGRPLEIEAIWGAPQKFATKKNLEMPLLEALHEEILALNGGEEIE